MDKALIERAVKAELELIELKRAMREANGIMARTLKERETKIAVLTEETDIQRASIQELSKINIGLQDQVESLKKENRLLRHDQTERIIEGNNLRSVAYAATYAVECWDKGFGTPQAMPELKQALVNLEGG